VTPKTENAVKVAVLVAGALGLLGMAWNSKADRSDVEALRQTMQRVDERTARIERFLCQDRASDLGCQR
jgi:hypothetical protein